MRRLFGFGFAALMAASMTMPLISLPEPPASRRRWKGRRTSIYMPHQGERECARRVRQMAVCNG